MMPAVDVSQALEQLKEIRHHLGRNEIYRGYRSKTLALTGAVGVLAAFALEFVWGQASPLEIVGFWVAVASVNLAVSVWEILGDYGNQKTEHQKRITKRTLGQFLPTLAAGCLVTAVFGTQELHLEFLPGIWAVLYSLGIFASRPYLPRGVGWVGAYFLTAGALMLCMGPMALTHGFVMGCVFGVGQFWLAIVMYQNLERENL